MHPQAGLGVPAGRAGALRTVGRNAHPREVAGRSSDSSSFVLACRLAQGSVRALFRELGRVRLRSPTAFGSDPSQFGSDPSAFGSDPLPRSAPLPRL